MYWYPRVSAQSHFLFRLRALLRYLIGGVLGRGGPSSYHPGGISCLSSSSSPLSPFSSHQPLLDSPYPVDRRLIRLPPDAPLQGGQSSSSSLVCIARGAGECQVRPGISFTRQDLFKGRANRGTPKKREGDNNNRECFSP